MSTLDDYRRAVEEQRDLLFAYLAGGSASAAEIVNSRAILALMEEDLRQRATDTVNYYEFSAGQQRGVKGPFLWQKASAKRVLDQLFWPTEAQRLQKLAEYQDLLEHKLTELNVKTHTGGTCDVQYFIEDYLVPDPPGLIGPPRPPGERSLVDRVKKEFMTAVQDWMRDQAHDPAFYKTSAVVGLATVLEERQDIIYALRIAQSRGTTVSEFPIEIGIVAEVLGSGVECLPVIGNALSLVEAYEGRDLFCRKLSPFDRALLVAMVLIPAGSRLVKGGRALYTAARLEYMYGRGAWSKLLGFAERSVLSNSPPAKVILKEAGLLVKAEQKLTASLAKDAEKALATLGGKGAATVPSRSAAEKLLLEELRKLGSAKAVIKELDELALKRVVDAAATKAGPSVAMAKGQLLEEFKEARTVRLLQEHLGVKALGLEAGKMRPQYFPGHMLRDDAGRKITDGLVARRVASGKVQQAWYGKRSPEQIKKIEGVLDVLAVDECKGGRATARELGYIRDVTTADRVVLDAVAVKRFEKAKRQAATAGKPLTTTLEDIQKDVAKEYKMGEMGGQARADIERLDAFEDGSLPSIFVGDAEYLVRLKSISSTKIFGVLPKDIAKSSGALVRKLQSQGLNFEVLGINIMQKELEDVAAEVLQKAATAK